MEIPKRILSGYQGDSTDRNGARTHPLLSYARSRAPCRIPLPAALLGLRFLRRFRLARLVERDCLTNERLERGLVNFFSFVDVDRAAYVSVETRVEETRRIFERRALGEGKLHDVLV